MFRRSLFPLSTASVASACRTRRAHAPRTDYSLESAPRLTFGGAVDLLVAEDLADDVVAVARELLSNVVPPISHLQIRWREVDFPLPKHK